jgi:hypothetical protein
LNLNDFFKKFKLFYQKNIIEKYRKKF